MEHALHNRGERLSDGEKIGLANDFRRHYSDDPEGSKALLKSEGLSAPGSFDETWAFLEHGLHSLERWSNPSLVLEP